MGTEKTLLFVKLGIEKIPARVIRKVLKPEEGKAYLW